MIKNKVKVIFELRKDIFEKKINEFLSKNNVKNINFKVIGGNGYTSTFIAFVRYWE